MQFTQRQRHFLRRWRPLLAAISIGLLLGFAGPFGSYPAFPTATRYAFWLGLTVAGVLAAIAAQAVLPASRFRAVAIRILATALVSALPMTFVVAWTMSLVQPGRVYAPMQLPALFAAVTAVQLLIAYAISGPLPEPGGAEESHDNPTTDVPVEDPDAPAFPPALLNRLPPAIGGDIIALETEDHYLRVHTAEGNALVLMRMADAVAMLDPGLGMQVHRRWWVARSAVVEMRTDGQRLSLCLADKTVVPVGRTFASATKAGFAVGHRAIPQGRSSNVSENPSVGRA